ncbi:MAG: hypothetical protein LBK97_06405 [Prevotellaceae bacterium]|nr:hypothetical protein [Prevotellaceae bacterium]
MCVIALSVCSCASKKATGEGVEIELNRVEKLQLEKPSLRMVGSGQHFNESTARNVAELQARGQFVRAISARITPATKAQAGSIGLYGGNDTKGQSVSDQSDAVNDFVSSVAQEIVKNAGVIDYIKFKLPNNQYKIYVCLEYQAGGISEMANEIAKTFEQKIPEDQKLKVKFEFDRYKKEVEEDLKSYKEER